MDASIARYYFALAVHFLRWPGCVCRFCNGRTDCGRLRVLSSLVLGEYRMKVRFGTEMGSVGLDGQWRGRGNMKKGEDSKRRVWMEARACDGEEAELVKYNG